jgi:formylglycine-generating enzyme required for sulfatase activity
VSREDAQKFCTKLSQRTNRRVTLATEAEWEYACQAGASARYYCGDSLKERRRRWRFLPMLSQSRIKQPRPTLLLEAGTVVCRSPSRTIIVAVGQLHPTVPSMGDTPFP